MLFLTLFFSALAWTTSQDVVPTGSSQLDPYAGWSLPKAQDGLVALGCDPHSRLEEFAVEATGTTPARDPQGRLVSGGKSAFEDPGCALVLVLIPAGRFEMGSPDELGLPSEHPRHPVELGPFFLAKTELPQALWERVMGSNPSRKQGALLPVTDVSWVDAGRFCERTSLARPTEAQWEYACRAGTTAAYSFGDDARELAAHAWTASTSPGQDPQPIATKKANPWGLLDVHGNAWEWCQDSAHGDYVGAPADGSAWMDPAAVLCSRRGGSFNKGSEHSRSAIRGWSVADRGWYYVGFRPARAVLD